MQLNFVRLALTQSGFLLGLSPAIVGFMLSRTLGPERAIASIVLASAFVVAMGLVSARLAVAYREPTASLAQHFLGNMGGRVVGLALATSFVGWLRIHALAISAAATGAPSSSAALLVGCAVLSVLLVKRDNAWIARLSAIQGPALMALFAATLLGVGTGPLLALNFAHAHADPAAVLLIVAAGLSDVIDMPTLLHRARSRAAAMGSVLLTYGCVLPAMLIFGVLVGADLGPESLVAALAQGGPAYALAVKVLLVGSATVANAGLLWSGSTSLATAFATAHTERLRWGMSALGLVLSFAVVGASVEAVLSVLGAVTGGVGFVMLMAFALDRFEPRRGRAARDQRDHVRAAALAVGTGLVTLLAARTLGFAEASGIWAAAVSGVVCTLGLRLMSSTQATTKD